MARIPKCMCAGCNNVGIHKVMVYRRGEGSGYMCDFHYNQEESYFLNNNNIQGVKKKNSTTVGVEFETSFSTEKARIEFLASGYIPTADCTVDVEYKSPIMNGLNSLSKHCVTFERLVNENQLQVNEDCGTHLNVGNTEFINSETINYIRRFYHSLFVPLSEAMKESPEAVKELFGRSFNHWAQPINEATDPWKHENFINLQSDNRIEFRICKFVNAKQYMAAAKFSVACVNAIIENFIKHFNDDIYDIRRYENITKYRKHKAQVTAKKLVKLFEKYSNS